MKIKKIRLINNFRKIEFNKSFIFSALNLSFLSYLCSGSIKIPKNFFLWCDGIFGTFISQTKKTPGSEFLEFFFKKKFSKIIIAGSYSRKQIDFVEKKFKTKVETFLIPNVNFTNIKKYIPKVKKNSLLLITLPTPKQEILAYLISKKQKNYKILCIGGGLNIAAGEERKCPKFLSQIGLETIWRLRNDTWRRLKRLIHTSLLIIFYYIRGDLKKVKLIKI